MSKVMHPKVKKMKVATIISIVFSSIALVMLLINLLAFLDMEFYFEYFDSKLETIAQWYPIYDDSLLETFRATFYIAIIITLLVNLVINITILVLSIVCLNKTKMDYAHFIKKRGCYITLIIFYGIDFFSTNSLSLVYSIGGLCNILIIISFVFAIIAISGGKEQSKISVNQATYGNDPFAKDTNGLSVYQSNMEVQKQNITHESNVVALQKEADDIFSEIADLERAFKNNEINVEYYQRRKEELLNKLIK